MPSSPSRQAGSQSWRYLRIPHRFRRNATASLLLAVFLPACVRDQDTAAEAPNGGRCTPSSPPLLDLGSQGDTIMVVSPHPDDEVLGFSGVLFSARKRGQNAHVVIATDGQAYCEACAFWKTAHPPRTDHGDEECTLAELAEFGAVRRTESLRALALLGVPRDQVTFLGQYDATLQAAWRKPKEMLVRQACREGEAGKAAQTTGAHLELLLAEVMEAHRPRVIFTTHALDGHPDHAALNAFVHRAAGTLPGVRFYSAVIHDRHLQTCNYPNPKSPRCFDLPDGGYGGARLLRYAPRSRWVPPTDAAYGTPIEWCLDAALFEGGSPLKLRAINSYRTQIGTIDHNGNDIPKGYEGWTDRNGYFISFVHRNEIYFADPPDAPR
jgi:LmbE family N-acetylglucosaminyl deacetylase